MRVSEGFWARTSLGKAFERLSFFPRQRIKHSLQTHDERFLGQDLDRFAEAFVEQLATYALRRVMTIDDAGQIKAIAAASKKDGYKLRAVIENLVLSELFQKR